MQIALKKIIRSPHKKGSARANMHTVTQASVFARSPLIIETQITRSAAVFVGTFQLKSNPSPNICTSQSVPTYQLQFQQLTGTITSIAMQSLRARYDPT